MKKTIITILTILILPTAVFALSKYDIKFTEKMNGKILLQVQQHGEAWYIAPDGKRYYIKNGETAYEIMKKFGQGITDVNLEKIPIGILSEKVVENTITPIIPINNIQQNQPIIKPENNPLNYHQQYLENNKNKPIIKIASSTEETQVYIKEVTTEREAKGKQANDERIAKELKAQQCLQKEIQVMNDYRLKVGDSYYSNVVQKGYITSESFSYVCN